VLQQSTAAAEISANTVGAAERAELVVSVLAEVAQTATKTRDWSGLALSASESPADSASNLRTEVEGFLNTVVA
jgi:hypothetical protein